MHTYAPITIAVNDYLGYSSFYCGSTANQVLSPFWWRPEYDIYTVPNIDFVGTPTDGASPMTVTFTDTSNQTVQNTWRKWNFGDGSIDNSSASPVTHVYSNPGVYSVRLDTWSLAHGYFDLTKSEYITTISPSGYQLLHYVKNSESGVLIDGATIGLKNTTSGKWVYSTASTGYKVWNLDADGIPLGANQTVELYAYKSGYTATNSTLTIPYDSYTHYSFMLPTSVVNATGTGTLVVTAVKNSDGTPLSGVSIILDTNQLGMTNAAGATTMRNVSAGSRTLQATLNGYQSMEKSFTITEGQTTMVIVDLVKIGATPITTYISPASTSYLVDTDGDGIGDTSSSVVGNYTPGQLNQTAASGIMQFLGLLMQLWPLVVVLILNKLLKVV